jgi:hypothetical protein
MIRHILEILDGALKFPAVDCLGGLASVLEGNAEIGASGASRLGRVDGMGSVSNHCDRFDERSVSVGKCGVLCFKVLSCLD